MKASAHKRALDADGKPIKARPELERRLDKLFHGVNRFLHLSSPSPADAEWAARVLAGLHHAFGLRQLPRRRRKANTGGTAPS